MGFLNENNIRFLNREVETRRIQNFIEAPEPGILGIHGPGGIGKTVLLWWTADECTRRNMTRAYVDLDSFPFLDSVDVMRAIAGQLNAHLEFADFWETLSGYHSHLQSRFFSLQARKDIPPSNVFKDRDLVMASFMQGIRRLTTQQSVVLLFDNFDDIPSKNDRDRLETEVFGTLSAMPRVRPIFAARSQVQWRNPAMNPRYGALHLSPFDDSYTKYLTSTVLPELLERDAYLRALKVSGGHPYSVMRLAKTGFQYFELKDDELYERLMEELWTNVISRFMLKGVSSTLQGLLAQISIVRFFDISGLRYFSQVTDLLTSGFSIRFLDVIDSLSRDVSAIRFDEAKKGYKLQPPIRPVSLELHRLSQALGTLNQIAIDFYTKGLQDLRPGLDEWRRCIIEIMYHKGVIDERPEEAKALLAQALMQLRSMRDIDAAVKLRDELSEDGGLPPSLWQDVFAYFERHELGDIAA